MPYSWIAVGSPACPTVCSAACHRRGPSRSPALSPPLCRLRAQCSSAAGAAILEPLDEETGFFPLLVRVLPPARMALLSIPAGSASPLRSGTEEEREPGAPTSWSLSWEPCHPALLRVWLPSGR